MDGVAADKTGLATRDYPVPYPSLQSINS